MEAIECFLCVITKPTNFIYSTSPRKCTTTRDPCCETWFDEQETVLVASRIDNLIRLKTVVTLSQMPMWARLLTESSEPALWSSGPIASWMGQCSILKFHGTGHSRHELNVLLLTLKPAVACWDVPSNCGPRIFHPSSLIHTQSYLQKVMSTEDLRSVM